MSIHRRLLQILSLVVLLTMLFSSFALPSASAQGKDGIERQFNAQTGKMSFLGPENGRAVAASKALGTSVRPQDPAMALAKRFGPEFGLKDPIRDLKEMRTYHGDNGRITARYQQNYEGIPVMGGELIVNTNERGDLYSINGEVSSNLSLETQPTIDAEAARQTTLEAMAKWYQQAPEDFVVSEPELWIYDENLLRPSTRPAELVWRMEVTSVNLDMPMRELVLINAQRGNLSLHFNQIDTAWAFDESSGEVQDPDSTPPPLPTETPLPSETPLPTETPEPVVTPTSAPEQPTSTEEVPTSNEARAGIEAVTGATWYVATTGNDTNSCSTPAAPCKTIDGAVGKATNNDLLKVAQGTYIGTGSQPVVTIAKILTLSGGWNIGFTAQTGYSTIDGEKTRQGVWLLSTVAHVTIDRFIIQNGTLGIANDGVLTVNNSLIRDNINAGGIWGGNITINNSALFNNRNVSNGGGISTQGSLTINSSTISNNVSEQYGGGIEVYLGTLAINNSTIANNSAQNGGGLYSIGGNITVKNSIIADNWSTVGNTPNCYQYSASLISDGNNIIDDLSGCPISPKVSDRFNVDPQLTPLIYSRGYHPLKSTSPAINAGNSATCFPSDQRGIARGGSCDIGAYEYTSPIPPATSLEIGTGSGQIAPPNELFLLPLQVVSLDIQGTPIGGVSVTFTSPSSGPGATLQNGAHIITLSTDAYGIATTTIKANGLSGSYSITASTTIGSVVFNLKNIAWFVKPTGNNTNDCLSPNTACLTLNEALNKADGNGTIFVATGIYKGTGDIVLTLSKDIKFSGGWTSSFTAQDGFSIIDGENVRSAVLVNSGVMATLENFMVEHSRNNSSNIYSGAVSNHGELTFNNCEVRHNVNTMSGGGIVNKGKLIINNCLVRDNSGVNGGGIYNEGSLTIDKTLITNNSAGQGGGIYNDSLRGPGIVALSHSQVTNNQSGGGGGGVYNAGTIEIINTGINSNSAGHGGGGIDNYWIATIHNVSLIENEAVGQGGGIRNTGTLDLNNSTISGNTSTFGAGIFVDQYSGNANLKNTILAGNSARTSGPDCSGTIQSSGNNIVGNTNSCVTNVLTGDQVNVNPQLGVFLPSEGYIPLLATSPAVNAGNPATCSATDQRGIARPQGSKCDIGAYEYTIPGPLVRLEVAVGSDQLTLFNTAFRKALQIAALDTNGSPVPGVSVNFQAPLISPSGIFGGTGTNTVVVVTNSGGIAQPASFTADNVMGTYNVVASATGVSSQSFTLHNGPWLVVPELNGGNDNNNDCISLGTACASLNGVLKKATFQDGDPVWMSVGTYGNSTDQAILTISKPVNVYGGWDVTFTDQIGTSIFQDMVEITVVIDVSLNNVTIQNTGFNGIRTFANLLVKDSTIRNNPATGIENNGVLTIVNSTITQNGDSELGWGNGGVYNSASNPSANITIADSTITNNKGDTFGGVGNDPSSSHPIQIRNTIIAGNTALYGRPYSPDCAGKFTSNGNNIIGNAGNINGNLCDVDWHTTDQAGYYLYDQLGNFIRDNSIDPMLGALQELGNNIWIHPLRLGSPAIDAGPWNCGSTDQRGVARPQGASCDIGAYEYEFNHDVSNLLITTYSAGNSANLVSTKVCDQTDLACTLGDAHAKAAHKYAIGIYNLYRNSHGRNSLDNKGIEVLSTVHYGSNYRNVLWNGYMIVYGDGYGYPLADDIVAHEFTHGVTQYESNLFYYYQSGAINESLSDLWGEYYDQSNGLGNDAPNVKWQIGEDAGDPAWMRSMSNPLAYGDPDKMSSSLYYEGVEDSGGIHTNSGVNNKAISLMVDGGTFNGKTVSALGWEKTVAIYYEANTNLLISGSDYSDLYYALQQSCTNLIGQKGITSGDCAEVKDAIDAVEMNAQPAPNFNTDAPLCSANTPVLAFADDLEAGIANWTFTNGSNNRWQWDSLYGQYAQSGNHSLYADDAPASITDASARLTSFVVPNGAYLHFAHAFDFETGSFSGSPTIYNFDGGVLEYSPNGGVTWIDAGSLIESNGYKGMIYNGYGYNNPLKGRTGFVGSSHGYISTKLNLASLAEQTVTFRWRMGLDESHAARGWWVDNIKVYTCGAPAVFADVANTHWAWQYVERLYNAGITGGCSVNPRKYCPEGSVTRAQMAIFLERGMHGSLYAPPAAGNSTGFGDVQPTYWAGAWIKQLAVDGVTGGCGNGNYCPESPVTRAQMAVFLLRSKHGASYSPPSVGSSTGFGDVQSTYWASAWIKQLVAEGITAGCGNGNYCPESPVTRAQMAVFLVRTFNLP